MSSQEAKKPVDPPVLVQTILEKTEQGRIKWETTADEDVLIASVAGDTTLQSTRIGPTEFALILLDADGKWIDRIDKPYVFIESQFNLARRRSRRIDEKVESIMTTIQNF